jgi:glycosyltransferase involved in cell wall biosynthesis
MKDIKIAIDASRNRSGGAKIHLIGILKDINYNNYKIDEVHVWSYQELLDQLPNYPWLKKHSPFSSKTSLIKELYWQNRKLPNILKKLGIDILLNTDAGSICYFKPNITMSRDMLSYEKGEMERFGISIARLRLFILKYVQKKSLLNSDGAIFLTKYASSVIQKFTGKIKNYKIIHHGISEDFRLNKEISDEDTNHKLKCIYVSNVTFYKHQWNVVRAFSLLKKYNIELILAGKLGSGKAKKMLDKAIAEVDPKKEFISTTDQINHEEIPSLLNDSDIFIFASSCENMPNTLVEAMAAGMPIACSDRGPMPEILRDGGLYFDPENIDSIYKAISTLVKDKNLRASLSRKSKNYSEEYSWGKCSKKTFNYLIEICDKFHNKNKESKYV